MPDDDGSVTITLTKFEALALSTFLGAYIPATPAHLRGPMPEIKQYLDSEIIQAHMREEKNDAGVDR